jgi:hypothetical protein
MYPRPGDRASSLIPPFAAGPRSTRVRQHFAGLQKKIGNQAVLRMLARSDRPSLSVQKLRPAISSGIQRNLAVSQTDHVHERGADRVAEPIMRVPLSSPAQSNTIQRKCACGGSGTECESCKDKREEGLLQRKTKSISPSSGVPAIVHEVLRSPGQPLDSATRAFFEPRFGRDFSGVRIHSNPRASDSASSVNALAYTVGNDIVFGSRQYSPATPVGRKLLAHELAHTVQQRSTAEHSRAALSIGGPATYAENEAERAADEIVSDRGVQVAGTAPMQLARHCTPPSVCAPSGVSGSATQADITGTAQEVASRARRRRMTPTRAIATGQGGRARQLEIFLEKQQPGRLANLQGIFIDHDISHSFEATTEDCAEWISKALPAGSATPAGMAGATKDCTFVHGNLNQEALAFNTTTAATIGGVPREVWRVETLQTLVHETEHPRFEAAHTSTPPGVTSPTCTRANILAEISELAAILSEFPFIFDAASAEASATGPLHRSMNRWFDSSIQTGSESIKGALLQMGCQCNCPEVDAFVVDTFNFESGSWSTPQKDALHRELRRPKWGLRWPLAPSTP